MIPKRILAGLASSKSVLLASVMCLLLIATNPLVPRCMAAEGAAKGGSRKPETPAAGESRSDTNKEEPILEHPFPQRQPAPSLDGGVAWINTAGPLELKQLRGKFVVLDFWTYCCINCMHILPVLKKLEHAYPNEIVVIGVHSAKFDAEQDSSNITEAVQRYEIEHPVINDARHVLWDKYFVQSWPSLRIIDPEGNLVVAHSGEIDFDTLDRFFAGALRYYKQKGVLDETPLRFDLAAYRAPQTPLRFPGKILADEPGERLFIADSNHNRIVAAKLDGTLIDTIGSGSIGKTDGGYDSAQFDHPQGMALTGDTLYVADTENHLLRKVDLQAKQVSTLAGTGAQGSGWPGIDAPGTQPVENLKLPNRWVGKPRDTALNSPWAFWIHNRDLFIAMAGAHQIWKMPLNESEIGPYAGNGREDIVDGPLLPKQPYQQGFCSFAQPSGLTSDGNWLYVADSEGSSIREVPFHASQRVHTILGTADLSSGRLFTFGDVDGKGKQVRLQHPLDVAWYEGRLYVADTYNSKIKVIDPAKKTAETLAGSGKASSGDNDFDQPTGLSAAAGKLYVADTNNHRIRTIDLKDKNVATLEIRGLEPPKTERVETVRGFKGAVQVEVPPATVKSVDGKIRLAVQLVLPGNFKINPLAPLRYYVESTGDGGPVARDVLGKFKEVDSKKPSFTIELPVSGPTGSERLTVSLAYYYCKEGAEGLCKAGSVAWTLPLTVSADAPSDSIPLEFKVK